MRTGMKRFAAHLLAAAAAIALLFLAKGMDVRAGSPIHGYVDASHITAQNLELTGNTVINMDQALWIESITGWGFSLTIQGNGQLHVDYTGSDSFAMCAKEIHIKNGADVSVTHSNGDAIGVSTFMTVEDSYLYAEAKNAALYAPSGNVTCHNANMTLVGHNYYGLYAETQCLISDSFLYAEGAKSGLRVESGSLLIDGSTLEIHSDGNGVYSGGEMGISNSDVDSYGLLAFYSPAKINLGSNVAVLAPKGAYVNSEKTTVITPDGYKAQHAIIGIVSETSTKLYGLAVEPLTPGEGKVYLHGSGGGWTDLIDFALEEGYYWIEAKPEPGYYFDHWQDKNNFIVTTDNPVQIYLDKDMVFRAAFYPAVKSSYSITVNGGTSDKSTAAEGEKGTVSASSPPTGKEFAYWLIYGPTIGVDDTTQETITFTMPAGDLTFNGYFVDKICSYSFDANGGSGTMPGATGVTFGTVITLPKCSFGAPSGKTFDHWQVFGMSYDPGDPLTIDDDITIQAVWKSSAPAAASSTPPSPPSPPPHEHHYEWTTVKEATTTEDGMMYYMCTSCGHVSATQVISSFAAFCDDAKNRIKTAPAGGTVVVMTDIYMSFPKEVFEALAARPDINLVIQFKFEGHRFQVTVPAGYPNVMGFVNGDGYAGFLYLCSILGCVPLS